MSSERYVPAAGRAGLTGLYDPAIAVTMRERTFRGALLAQIRAPPAPQAVLDVGCGTGALAIALAATAPQPRIVALDGDPAALLRARTKARRAGVEVEFAQALADELPCATGAFDCVVSSLLLHHLSPPAKVRALAEFARVLRPGGRLHIADWGKAHDPLMRLLFVGLQLLDGFANTRDHAAGRLPALIAAAGFDSVRVTGRLRTAWGSLELLCAQRTTDQVIGPSPGKPSASAAAPVKSHSRPTM